MFNIATIYNFKIFVFFILTQNSPYIRILHTEMDLSRWKFPAEYNSNTPAPARHKTTKLCTFVIFN